MVLRGRELSADIRGGMLVTDHSSRGDRSLLTDTPAQLHNRCPQGTQPEENNNRVSSREATWSRQRSHRKTVSCMGSNVDYFLNEYSRKQTYPNLSVGTKVIEAVAGPGATEVQSSMGRVVRELRNREVGLEVIS